MFLLFLKFAVIINAPRKDIFIIPTNIIESILIISEYKNGQLELPFGFNEKGHTIEPNEEDVN